MINEYNELLTSIEQLNSLLKRGLITLEEFFKRKSEYYQQLYIISSILTTVDNINQFRKEDQ